MPDAVLGIDPGLDGGLCCLSLGGDVLALEVMPVAASGKGREVDVGALAALIAGLKGQHAVRLAAVEKAGARPGEGVNSVFSFGRSYGVLLGVLGALGVPVESPTPQRWQAHVLGSVPTGQTKLYAAAYCARRFPGASLRASPRCRKAHEGLADALAIAEFARRIVVGTRTAVPAGEGR